MVLPQTLHLMMERIAQNLTVIRNTRSQDTYGRLSDIETETKAIKGFINYNVEQGRNQDRTGFNISGGAVVYVKSEENLEPRVDEEVFIEDEKGDLWKVQRRLQSVHTEDKLPTFNVFEITLSEQPNNN